MTMKNMNCDHKKNKLPRRKTLSTCPKIGYLSILTQNNSCLNSKVVFNYCILWIIAISFNVKPFIEYDRESVMTRTRLLTFHKATKAESYLVMTKYQNSHLLIGLNGRTELRLKCIIKCILMYNCIIIVKNCTYRIISPLKWMRSCCGWVQINQSGKYTLTHLTIVWSTHKVQYLCIDIPLQLLKCKEALGVMMVKIVFYFVTCSMIYAYVATVNYDVYRIICLMIGKRSCCGLVQIKQYCKYILTHSNFLVWKQLYTGTPTPGHKVMIVIVLSEDKVNNSHVYMFHILLIYKMTLLIVTSITCSIFQICLYNSMFVAPKNNQTICDDEFLEHNLNFVNLVDSFWGLVQIDCFGMVCYFFLFTICPLSFMTKVVKIVPPAKIMEMNVIVSFLTEGTRSLYPKCKEITNLLNVHIFYISCLIMYRSEGKETYIYDYLSMFYVPMLRLKCIIIILVMSFTTCIVVNFLLTIDNVELNSEYVQFFQAIVALSCMFIINTELYLVYCLKISATYINVSILYMSRICLTKKKTLILFIYSVNCCTSWVHYEKIGDSLQQKLILFIVLFIRITPLQVVHPFRIVGIHCILPRVSIRHKNKVFYNATEPFCKRTVTDVKIRKRDHTDVR